MHTKVCAPGGEERNASSQALCDPAQSYVCPGTLLLILLEALKSP